jgi:hypothetical protein
MQRPDGPTESGRFCALYGPIVAVAISTCAAVPEHPGAGSGAPAETGLAAVATAGARYQKGPVHRFFLGSDYRDLWAQPIRVEVLDLGRVAGGLTPVKRVGGQETHGLALRGADGRNYTFRGVDKDPSAILPPDLRGTIAEDVVQDQIAADHPAAPLVVPPLLEAAGVLHVEPRFVVMPDDERLGDFRHDFAGLLGTFEEFPGAASQGHPGFGGATRIIDGKELLVWLRRSSETRVDSRAFLRARLMDLFFGDWDRHLQQWRWVEVPGKRGWQPLPEDRDQAFCRFEGVLLVVARNWQPRLVDFDDDYPDMLGLTWNAWPLDRRFLSDLEKPAWDEIAADLKRRITDQAIDAAVHRLPEEYRRLDGERLSRTLKRRRDRLEEAASAFYRHLAEEVRIEATDEPEVAEIVALEGGGVEVVISRADASGAQAGEPWFRRRFRPDETREVRLYLQGGNDRIRIRGKSDIVLRVLGGEGDDLLDDSAGGGTHFIDWQGNNRIVPGEGTDFDDSPDTTPIPSPAEPWIPHRDWGRQTTLLPWFVGGPQLGAFVGAGLMLDRYGFRKYPYARRQIVRVGYSTGANAFKADYQGEFHRENSGIFLTLGARFSQLEILRFFGLGNETSSAGPEKFFEVRQKQLGLDGGLALPLAPALRLAVGPFVEWAATDLDPRRFIGLTRPYGSGSFGLLGGAAELRFDTRDVPASATRGVLLVAGGRIYPPLWDVRETFGEVHAEAATYLSAPLPLRPTLALRVLGERVFGTYPFHKAAFIGGRSSMRGYSEQRFAGDASAVGSAELRLLLGRYFFILPGDLGVFALADAGRVWLDGERSRRWHAAAGGGAWFAWLDRGNTLSAAVARGDEGLGVYVQAGFGY